MNEGEVLGLIGRQRRGQVDVDHLNSFDEFHEKKFSESRREAYDLMAIHEQLPRELHRSLTPIGGTKARELVKVARKEGKKFQSAS